MLYHRKVHFALIWCLDLDAPAPSPPQSHPLLTSLLQALSVDGLLVLTVQGTRPASKGVWTTGDTQTLLWEYRDRRRYISITYTVIVCEQRTAGAKATVVMTMFMQRSEKLDNKDINCITFHRSALSPSGTFPPSHSFRITSRSSCEASASFRGSILGCNTKGKRFLTHVLVFVKFITTLNSR